MKSILFDKIKSLSEFKSFSKIFEISIVKLQILIVFFVVGVYGFPSFTLYHESNLGLALRIFQLFSYFIVFIMWIQSILYFNRFDSKRELFIRFHIRSTDLVIGLILFFLSVVTRHKELASSITGDEIALVDSSLIWSKALVPTVERLWEGIGEQPARFVLASIQIWILGLIFIIVFLLFKFNFMHRIVLIATFFTFILYKLTIGESYYYPYLEVFPYLLSSPIYLIFGISPKYTAIAIFCIFLVVVYRLTSHIIHSAIIRFILCIVLSTSNILIDVTSTLNHSVYFIYITCIVLLHLRNNAVTVNMILLLLMFSVLRPTLLITLIIVFFKLLTRIEIEQITFKTVKLVQKYLALSIPIIMITVISRIVSMVYEIRSPQNYESIYSQMKKWIYNLATIDNQSMVIIFTGLIVSLILRQYLLILYLVISLPAFWFFIPFANFSGPIYRVEVLAPAIIISTILIGELITFYYRTILASKKIHFILKSTSIYFVALHLFLSIQNYDDKKFRNFAWNVQNEKYLILDVQQKSSDEYQEHQIFGKVRYTREIIEMALDQNCKFLDVVYNGSFLLESNVSMNLFTTYTSNFSANELNLSSEDSINCIILGNYPEKKFYTTNSDLNLGFRIRYVFQDPSLGTSVNFYFR